MDTSSIITRPPTPVPASPTDFIARNLISRPKSLNDAVDGIVIKLMSDEDFIRFLEPAYTEQSVHGDLFLDDAELARMIIGFAEINNEPLVADTKLKGVIRAMNVALRRYNFTRKQRRAEAEALEEHMQAFNPDAA